jgi:hypothetical protein
MSTERMDEEHWVALPPDLFADITGAQEDPATRRLVRLGRDLRRDLDPTAWDVAGREARIEMARHCHSLVCRCFRIWVCELFFEPSRMGSLVRRDPLTDRIVGSLLLIDDPDPLGLLRAVIQENCYRARERLVRNSRWFRLTPWQRLLRRLRRKDDGESPADQLDVLDLEPTVAAATVLEAYRGQA